jgi:hypothetical protein
MFIRCCDVAPIWFAALGVAQIDAAQQCAQLLRGDLAADLARLGKRYSCLAQTANPVAIPVQDLHPISAAVGEREQIRRTHPTAAPRSPARETHRSCGVCHRVRLSGTRARWPADESSRFAQHSQRRALGVGGVHVWRTAKPFAAGQNDFPRLNSHSPAVAGLASAKFTGVAAPAACATDTG